MGTAAAIGAAGALGAWTRYLVGLALARRSMAFPWGTLLINVSGCVLIALVGAVAARVPAWAAVLRTDAETGFVGAYTTFSTFSIEALLLWETRPGRALLYMGSSVAAGLAGIAAGAWLGARL